MAAILVIFVHSYTFSISLPNTTSGNVVLFIQNIISHGIARIAVPLFFCMSGYLFFLNFYEITFNYYLKIIKKVRTVLVPYILWSLWGVAFYFILQTAPITKMYFTHNLLVNYNITDLVSVFLINTIPYQLWFLRDLMVLSVLSFVIYTFIKYLKFYSILLLIVGWFLNINYVLFSNQAILFFATGAYLCLFKQEWLVSAFLNKSRFFTLIWMVLIVAKTFLMEDKNPGCIMSDILHKLSILTGLIALWNSYDDLFKNKNFTDYKWYSITSFTFFLFLFHEPTLTIFKKFLFILIGKDSISHLIVYIVAPVLTILTGLFIGAWLKRCFPKFYNVVCGGR